MHLPRAVLNQVTQALVGNACTLSAMSEYGFDFALQLIADLKVASSPRRLATALQCSMPHETLGAAWAPPRLHLTRDQIGVLANQKRDALNRKLSRLTRRGVVALGFKYVDSTGAGALQRIAREGHQGDDHP